MRKAIIGLVVLGLLALAGCGGDESTTIGKQEYDQQVEVICNKGLQEREALIEKLSREYQETGKQANTDLQTESILRLIAAYQTTTEEIDDLGLPEQSEKKAEEFVEAREEAAARVEADPLGSVGVSAGTFDKANEAAEALKAESCAT